MSELPENGVRCARCQEGSTSEPRTGQPKDDGWAVVKQTDGKGIRSFWLCPTHVAATQPNDAQKERTTE